MAVQNANRVAGPEAARTEVNRLAGRGQTASRVSILTELHDDVLRIFDQALRFSPTGAEAAAGLD